jgi:DNA replication protein DnaC
MVANLTRAATEGRLDENLKVSTVPRLLIVDEIGYLPIDRLRVNLLFQLISRRYERGPLILTSNQSFSNWGRRLRGSSHRCRHSRSGPSSRNYRQHAQRQLPTEGEDQSGSAQEPEGHDVMNPWGKEFR